MTGEQLSTLRDRLHLDDVIPDEAFSGGIPPYFRLPPDSPEFRVPARTGAGRSTVRCPRARCRCAAVQIPPADAAFVELLGGSGGQAASTTTAFTRLLRNLCRDPSFGTRVVPIIPDEARTFGMDSLFRELEDLRLAGPATTNRSTTTCSCRTRRASDGQILEEGITEAGGLASGPPRPPATRPAACRWSRSSPSIRCSASSGSAT